MPSMAQMSTLFSLLRQEEARGQKALGRLELRLRVSIFKLLRAGL